MQPFARMNYVLVQLQSMHEANYQRELDWTKPNTTLQSADICIFTLTFCVADAWCRCVGAAAVVRLRCHPAAVSCQVSLMLTSR